MELKIDAEGTRAIVAKAIMDELGEGAREKLIESAITNLLTEPAGAYGTKLPSPLQMAFNAAAAEAAREIVRTEVASSPEFIARIRSTVGTAMLKLDEENFSDIVARAFVTAMHEQ